MKNGARFMITLEIRLESSALWGFDIKNLVRIEKLFFEAVPNFTQ